jgi:hypothetical protein
MSMKEKARLTINTRGTEYSKARSKSVEIII